MTQKGNVIEMSSKLIEMCMALLQMLADSLRIWCTARRDTLLVRDIHAVVIGDSP